MKTKTECCAIIPARGGSKGVIGKNLRVAGGLPLIAHSITAARAAERVQRVVVSTEDPAIAEVALRFGAQVVWRPLELASDAASSEAALLHALDVLEREHGYVPDLLTFLQCTSPLTAPEDIDGTIAELIEQNADSALAVTAFHYFLWKHGADGNAIGVNHDKRMRLRRQDQAAESRTFLETGAVYAMKVPAFRAAKHRFFGNTAMYEIPAERVWEIDEPVDFAVAEVLLRHREQTALARRLPARIDAVVFDFDGVMTDNRVYIDQDGREAVRCHRGDGMGIEALRRTGVRLLVLSKEKNAVVQARCAKLQLACLSGIDEKPGALRLWCEREGVALEHTVYVGNDVNDLECMQLVGCGIAVADAHPEAKNCARMVLTRNGGQGAVRELCDMILERERRRT